MIETGYVRTYSESINLTISVEQETVRKARRRAEALGTSLNQRKVEIIASARVVRFDSTDVIAAIELYRLARVISGCHDHPRTLLRPVTVFGGSVGRLRFL
jgi:hypothetical protein